MSNENQQVGLKYYIKKSIKKYDSSGQCYNLIEVEVGADTKEELMGIFKELWKAKE